MGKQLNGKANRQTKAQIARRHIVARLFMRGNTEAEIREKVIEELGLKTYSSQTVHADIVALKKMWHDEDMMEVDTAIKLELKRIDDQIRELWDAWEKSKTDYKTRYKKQKGEAVGGDSGNQPVSIKTKKVEQGERDEVCFGDPRYMAEIRQQLVERRKLLGLYAPEKKDITGDMSFLAFLMESGMTDAADSTQ